VRDFVDKSENFFLEKFISVFIFNIFHRSFLHFAFCILLIIVSSVIENQSVQL